MARKYVKKITEKEFNQYLKLRDGYRAHIMGQTSWSNISAQEQARYERDYVALEMKLFHTLGFKESEEALIPYLKEAQDKFELFQELALNEDKRLKDAVKVAYEQKVRENLKAHAEEFKKTKARKTVFTEAFDELNKINK